MRLRTVFDAAIRLRRDPQQMPRPDGEWASSPGFHGGGRTLTGRRVASFFVSETLHAAGLRIGAHDHAYGCVHVVLRGRYSESWGARTVSLGSSEALLKPAGVRHWNEFTHDALSLRVEFPEWLAEQHEVALPQEPTAIFGVPLGRLATSLREELREPDTFTRLSIEGLCLELLTTCLRLPNRASRKPSRPPEYVRACAEHLRHRFRDVVRFEHLASELGVNRTQLATAFRRHHACTLGEFVRRLRVDFVKAELLRTRRPIVDIALAAGFSDHSHCCRVFRRLVGTPPARWRREFTR